MVKLLLESNAHPNNDTRSPLFGAVIHNRRAVVELLLKHKATVSENDLILALFMNYKEIVDLLKQSASISVLENVFKIWHRFLQGQNT